jgi:outer membrane protein assembly factor BamB
MLCPRTAIAFLLAAASLPAVDGWPRWRGPNDDGMARGGAPLAWSGKKGIAWKANIPGRGHPSPFVWGGRIFLTTAVPTGNAAAGAIPEHRFLVLAFDRNTGKQLWERVARVATPHQPHHAQYGSFASNSPITDGKLLYAYFGSRGLYAYTLDGKLVWEKDFGPFQSYNNFGEGSWPTLHENRLILALDHEGESFLVSLDKATGKEIWRTPRDGRTSWAGPLVIAHAGKKQILVSASRNVVAYDFETGKTIWETIGLGQNTIPAPVVSDGIAVVMSGFRNPNLLAIRLGREGNLAGTDAILWQNQRGNAYSSSPVIYDGKIYFLTDSGMLSCFDVKTGKPYYHQVRLPKPYNFKASLVGADGKLYLASEDSDVIVVKMGETFEVLATNTLEGQTFIATPAIVEGAIYLRSQNTLFCIR